MSNFFKKILLTATRERTVCSKKYKKSIDNEQNERYNKNVDRTKCSERRKDAIKKNQRKSKINTGPSF